MNWFIAKLIAERLGVALATLAFVSVAVFLATELLPGDVAEVVLGQSATPEAVAGLRAALHPRLAAEIIDVPLDRGHAQHEAMGDLKVGGAGADPCGEQ